MVPDISQDPDDAAFDVRGHIGQNRNAVHAVSKGLAVDTTIARLSRKKESLCSLLLVGAENMDRDESAGGQTFENCAVGPDRRHDQRRFERRLRKPGHGGSAVMIATARCHYIHAIGQQPKRLASGHQLHMHSLLYALATSMSQVDRTVSVATIEVDSYTRRIILIQQSGQLL